LFVLLTQSVSVNLRQSLKQISLWRFQASRKDLV